MQSRASLPFLLLLPLAACRVDGGNVEPGGDVDGTTAVTPDEGTTDATEPPAPGSSGDGGQTSGGTTNPDPDSDSSGEPPPAPLECEGYDEADYPEEPVTFTIEGDRAIMAGFVDGSTPGRVQDLLNDHPNVHTIIMPFVPGSADDESNLEAALAIHAAGLDTCVPSTGLIASGGVDFFLAGARRSAAEGALLGVHSWADGNGTEGGDLPTDHPDHQFFLDYYEEIDIPAEFYWFTLEAAPAADIHWMTAKEMATYDVLTE